jgi:hypothetical protein
MPFERLFKTGFVTVVSAERLSFFNYIFFSLDIILLGYTGAFRAAED